MKHRLFVFAALLALVSVAQAQTYDFSAVSPNGQTLWYKINADSVSVSITAPFYLAPEDRWYSDVYEGFQRPTGNLIIPDTVVNNGNSYAVTALVYGALYHCDGITSVYIPKTLIDFGNDPWSGALSIRSYGLQNIIVDPANPVYDSRNNCNAIIHTATNSLAKGAYNTVIPNTVTTIGASAFAYATVPTTFDIPVWINTIDNHAFDACHGLTSVNVPEGISRIEDETFFSCFDLEQITLPSTLKYIGGRAFCNDGNLTAVILPDSLETIAGGAFYNTGLISIYIPSSVTSIASGGETPFRQDTNLISIIVDEGNTVYDSRNGCNAIIETATNTLIMACKTTVIPSSVRRIGGAAFHDIPVPETLVIPDSVETMDSWALAGLWPITKIVFGSSITEMNSDVFGYGVPNSLQSIELRSPIPPTIIPGWYVQDYLNIPADFPIRVPCGTTAAYQAAPGWSNFTNYVETAIVTVATQNNIGGMVNVIQSPSCSDSTAIVEVVAWTGYRFSSWTDGDTTNPRTISIVDDTTLMAIFVGDSVIVTATANLGLTSSVTGSGRYARNQVATLRVSAPAGYAFLGWDNGSISNPYQFIASKDTVITARFLQYTQPDTTYVDVHDTIYVPVHDTTYVPVYAVEYVDNYIYDTTFVNTYVHDTTIQYVNNYVHDTTYINTYVHDTTIQYVNQYVHDTTYINNNIHDTLVQYVNQYVHDTLYINNYVHDTVLMNTQMYDTMIVNNYQFDTTLYSTYHFDTVIVNNNYYDTVFVHLHDTIYITEGGMDGANGMSAKVYSSRGQIVVEGAADNQVWLYDVAGREITHSSGLTATSPNLGEELNSRVVFDVPASGTYLIKIGNYPARRVVVK